MSTCELCGGPSHTWPRQHGPDLTYHIREGNVRAKSLPCSWATEVAKITKNQIVLLQGTDYCVDRDRIYWSKGVDLFVGDKIEVWRKQKEAQPKPKVAQRMFAWLIPLAKNPPRCEPSYYVRHTVRERAPHPRALRSPHLDTDIMVDA